MNCAICLVPLGVDNICPNCQRIWTRTEDGNIVSERRLVKLKKLPEKGDDLSKILEPLKPEDYVARIKRLRRLGLADQEIAGRCCITYPKLKEYMNEKD